MNGPSNYFLLENGVEHVLALSSGATVQTPVDLMVCADMKEGLFWESKRCQQNKQAQSSLG